MAANEMQWSSATPGLLIILLDQSGSMLSPFGASGSRTVVASTAVNRIIDTIIQKNFDGDSPKNRCFISVIGYNHNVKEICSGYLKDLDSNPLRVENIKKRQLDGAGGILRYLIASIMVYSASFMFSWGPICWVLISEIFPNTIRGGAVAIAVAFQWIFNFIVSSTFVPMYNMQLPGMESFGHIFAYALYGVICVIAAIFVWKMVPETKGKTLEDMNKLWKKQ